MDNHNGYRKQDTTVNAASPLYCCHDCIHLAQVENKGVDMVSLFSTGSEFVFSKGGRGPNGLRQTSVCKYVTQECTLQRTQDLEGQTSPNQLTFDASATTWGSRVTVSRVKDIVHHAPFDRPMLVGICPLWNMTEQ